MAHLAGQISVNKRTKKRLQLLCLLGGIGHLPYTYATEEAPRPATLLIPPTNQGDPTLLQADAAGTTTLMGSYGERTGLATVTVLAAGADFPIGTVQWSLPPLGSYGIAKSVQALRLDDDTPDLYIQDDGAYGGNGSIRALTADGQQKWIWPFTTANATGSAEPCDASGDPDHPGYPHTLQATDGTWSSSVTLHLMVIHPDGSYTTQDLDTVSASGTGLQFESNGIRGDGASDSGRARRGVTNGVIPARAVSHERFGGVEIQPADYSE